MFSRNDIKSKKLQEFGKQLDHTSKVDMANPLKKTTIKTVK